MEIVYFILGFLFCFVCSVLTYGITFSYFQGEFPELSKEYRMADIVFAIGYAMLGPIGLFLSFIMSGKAKYGLKFK